MTTHDELRRLLLLINAGDTTGEDMTDDEYRQATDPSTVLALLDEIAILRAGLEGIAKDNVIGSSAAHRDAWLRAKAALAAADALGGASK